MTVFRLIAPPWLNKPVLEGVFTDSEIKEYNSIGYNIYYLPNQPSEYTGGTVSGSDINVFNYIFVDCDLKDGVYSSKDAFLEEIVNKDILPSLIVDSGNGIHAYWAVSDLDAKSYLLLQRRIMRLFRTDKATCSIYQLLRYPGTTNTKDQNNLKPCFTIAETETTYTCEELDKLLPPVTLVDRQFCEDHYNNTYNKEAVTNINDKLPVKFGKLLNSNTEVKKLFTSMVDDRSAADFRLGHILMGNGFSKEEALSVLVNTSKALQRSPQHRVSYAENIVAKIPFNGVAEEVTSPTVREILSRGSDDKLMGTRFPCSRLIDDTEHGFRLGQVIGIIGGSGVGKTTLTLNTFIWFVQANPDFHHFFFSLEQPDGEIAARIRTICEGNESIYDKIHIISNYNQDGTFRHFSIDDIEKHMQDFKAKTGHAIGAAVIDHIGVLDKSIKNGENEGLIGVCKKMKAVAHSIQCMIIMLSQAPREKAGIGDIELDKSAAYGTVFFESYCDYCICLWQPLKRNYHMGAPTVMAIKFVKIRHKKQGLDRIQEDVRYQLYFDPKNEHIRELTQEEEVGLEYWHGQAVSARKLDKKTDLIPYQARRVVSLIEYKQSKH